MDVLEVSHVITLPFTFLAQRTSSLGRRAWYTWPGAISISACVLQPCLLWNGLLCAHPAPYCAVWGSAKLSLIWKSRFCPSDSTGFASSAQFGVTRGADSHGNCGNNLTPSTENMLLLFIFYFCFLPLGVTVANDSFKCFLWIWQ